MTLTWQSILTISLGAIFIENFVLTRFLGVCPFLGVTKKTDTAFGMSLSVIFVMTLSSAAAWVLREFLLVPFNLEYLETITYILVIAALVQILEAFLKKVIPAMNLGVFLPLITTNCAILGVLLINAGSGAGFIESVFFAFCSGIGFAIALLLFSSVRQRLEFSQHPEAFEGVPIALITAGLLALAFSGFAGASIF